MCNVHSSKYAVHIHCRMSQNREGRLKSYQTTFYMIKVGVEFVSNRVFHQSQT